MRQLVSRFFEKKSEILLFSIVAVIIVGIVLRSLFLSYNPDFWLDEVSLALNILNKKYFELFLPLDYAQVEPPFFTIFCKICLDISNTKNNIFLADLALRIPSFIFAILSLPLFALLTYKMFNSKRLTLVAVTFASYNLWLINYSIELKRYSAEVFFSILLIFIFYTLNLKTDNFKKISLYSLVFLIAPWFSSSAYFVLGAGFIYLIFDAIKNKNFDRNKFLILLLPQVLNFAAFLAYYIPIKQKYASCMDEFYTSFVAGFLNFKNFYSLFVSHIAKLFAFENTSMVAAYLVCCISILFLKKNYKQAFFILMPIALTLFASLLKMYPIVDRQILFLLPLFIILASQFIFLFKDDNKNFAFLLIFIIFATFANFEHSPRHKVMRYRTGRQMAKILINNNVKDKNMLVFIPRIMAYYLRNYIEDPKFNLLEIGKQYSKSRLIENLKNLPLGEVSWIMVPFASQVNGQKDSAIRMKYFILDSDNFEVKWVKDYTKDGSCFLIKAKKIKEF